MKKNRYIPIIIGCTIMQWTACNYQPIRYEQFLIQTNAALEAQRKLIEQKIQELQYRRQGSRSEGRDSHLTRRKARIADELLLSGTIALHTLENRLNSIKKRLGAVAEEKKKLARLSIADRNAETELIRKAVARETASDIQDQLQDIASMEQYFTRMPTGEVSPEAVSDLKQKWSAQRTELTKRLVREQALAR